MADLTGLIPASPPPDELLQTLLEVSLTAVNLLRPVYEAESNELIDFALEYINPAGQRMVGLPERPGGTLLSHFPAALPNGVFHFYRQVFETGEAGQHKVNYQADGLDNYFHLAAKRCGSLLVASFTDTADQDRSAVELTLRENQIMAQEGLAAVEAQRQQLNELFN